MSGTEDENLGPLGVSPNDETPEGWCEVTCVFPDLKVSTKFIGGKLVKRPEAGVFDCKFSQRSVVLTLECKNAKKKMKKYSYEIKKLPANIDPDESKVKYKNGKVILRLKKEEAKSWQREITSNGIDQHEEEDELEKGE
ncbi:uncharacterized protein [Watersipora subatra]|uniref:uncharacterized protein n=1 Tax=Watersipora subatra TaxID=2589382 RepID=UPI00355C92F1